jgi:3-oxoacyl-[acyl-carrier protein] reductase
MLAARGAHVVAAARGENAGAVVDEIVAAGGRPSRVAGGHRGGRRRRAGGRTVERHGRLDILVNNAGITRDQLMLRMKRDDWDAVIATNLTGTFALTQAALKPMIRQRAGGSSASARSSGRAATPARRTTPRRRRASSGSRRRSRSRWRPGASRSTSWRPGMIDTDMTRAITGTRARGLGVEDSAAAPRHTGRYRGGRVLPGIGRGGIYYGARPGRQRWNVYVSFVGGLNGRR